MDQNTLMITDKEGDWRSWGFCLNIVELLNLISHNFKSSLKYKIISFLTTISHQTPSSSSLATFLKRYISNALSQRTHRSQYSPSSHSSTMLA